MWCALLLPLLDSNQRIAVPKTTALPLGQGAIMIFYNIIYMGAVGFEPTNPKERIYSPSRLARLRYTPMSSQTTLILYQIIAFKTTVFIFFIKKDPKASV